jgi:SusD/RagB-like outer membrane lipoprotein
MKKFIISILVLAAFTSCSTDLDINRDPDLLDPNDAPLSAQLPAGIAGLAGAEGSSYAIIGGFWSQYWTQSNTANQYNDIDNYSIGTSDYNFAWNGMYDALNDIRNVKRKALATNNWNYYLIATVLEVQGSQILTDFYGDIPYTEANRAPEILEPQFDSGPEVYDLMMADLNDALSRDLTQSAGPAPGVDDFIFGGNMDNWTRFANTMKLKLYMRQTESSRAAMADAGIIALVNSGVAFLDTDAAMTQFSDEANKSNPLYEFNNRQLNVATNLRKSRTMDSFLSANSDPREAEFYLTGNSLVQGDYTSTATNIAIVNNKATAPVFFMSREESLLLQAEALERYSLGSGKPLYDAAVVTNFSRYGLDGTPFVAAGGAYEYPSAGTFDDKLEAIITQKWIANFPGNGFESFFEKNRTGYPLTSTVSQTDPGYVAGEFVYGVNGSTGGLFPRRLVYPLSERNANTNTPTLVTLTTPVWWDQP